MRSRRLLVVLSVLGLVATACVAQTPPERGALPLVEDVVELPRGCLVTSGGGNGIQVVSVIDDAAADGILQRGDLLTSLNGVEMHVMGDLVTQMQGTVPGDQIELDVIRDGGAFQTGLVLHDNPESPGAGFMGIMGESNFDEIIPSEIATDTSVSGGLVRLIGIEGELYALDTSTVTWSSIGQPVPQAAWATVGEQIYVLEEPATDFVALVRQQDGRVIDLITADWQVANVLGSVGNLILTSAIRTSEDNPGIAEVSVIGVNPESGVGEWLWPIPQEGGGVPLGAMASPDGSMALIVMAPPGGGVEQSTHAIIDWTGLEMAGPIELTPLRQTSVFGWLDEGRILYQTQEDSEVQSLTAYDLASDTSELITLPGIELQAETSIWATGNGSHIITLAGRRLGLVNVVDTASSRGLGQDCSFGVGPSGWGS